MKLSKTNRLRHRELLSSLRMSEQRLRMGVMGANKDLRRTMTVLAELVRIYNDERKKAAAFVEEIRSDAENLMEERSERWQDSDAGQALSMFIDEWSDALAELEETVNPPVLPEFELEIDLDNAILFDRLHINSDRFIPEFLNICYVMGPNEKGLGNNIDVRLVSNQFDNRSPKPDEPGVLSIYGSRTLKIIPAVSNVVYIGLEPR